MNRSGVGVVCDQVRGGCCVWSGLGWVLCDQVRGGCCVWSGLGLVLCVIRSGAGVVCDQVCFWVIICTLNVGSESWNQF